MSNFKGKNGALLIAEIGGNHEGDFSYAKKLTKLAIESEVDVIKFQIYTGDTLVSKIESPKRNKHFKKFELTKKEHIYLAEMVKEAKIKYSSSVWDINTLSWINKYIDIYKIGSGDLTAYPVLNKTAELGKPIIISSGLSSEKEVIDSVNYIQNVNSIYLKKNHLGILQCTSMYPIMDTDVNLKVLERFKEIFNLTIGYSDHTEGFKALQYAYAMGAEILEFHFTDDRTKKEFRDHKVSLTKEEIQLLINEINLINNFKGNEIKKPLKIEIMNGHDISFRRAVYPSRNLLKGETLSDDNLTVLRPNIGIDSRDYSRLIGKKVKRNFMKHEKLNWKNIE
tara:strand:- start:9885 stop:10898 length:1014 start_codon:yes stop_codon:yes gene_type:complete